MSKAQVLDLSGKPKGETNLGTAFKTAVRKDIIQRVFVSEQAAKRQPYGTDPLAGDRSSAHYHGSRHVKWTMMNREMARMKRIHNQGYLNYTARVVPYAAKGRTAHPPKIERVWTQKVNKKERVLALKSALSASVLKDLVLLRGHKVENIHVPLILENKFEELKSTKTVVEALIAIGLGHELDRTSEVKIRAGRGKMRGRRYKVKKGPLLVVTKPALKQAAKNILGVDVATTKELTMTLLAPGGQAGRLTIFSEAAIEELNKL